VTGKALGEILLGDLNPEKGGEGGRKQQGTRTQGVFQEELEASGESVRKEDVR